MIILVGVWSFMAFHVLFCQCCVVGLLHMDGFVCGWYLLIAVFFFCFVCDFGRVLLLCL